MTAPEDPAFHEGERIMQTRAGVRARLAALGEQVIRAYLPEQHRLFFGVLPFVVVGSVDAGGQPWASLLTNPPGFMGSPDPRRLRIQAEPSAWDPLQEALVPGARLALLGIEPHTRRRNRLNGHVEQRTEEGILVGVTQSFGNCPKYIQARRVAYRPNATPATVHAATGLNPHTRSMVLRADTFFIATAHPDAAQGAIRSHGVDVSHRGGKPGFVRVEGDHTLTIPEFLGNRFFNTLGNLLLHPRAGLLFLDGDTGERLYLAADAEIIEDSPEQAAFAGAERLLRLRIRQVTHVVGGLSLHWGSPTGISPFLANTGGWA